MNMENLLKQELHIFSGDPNVMFPGCLKGGNTLFRVRTKWISKSKSVTFLNLTDKKVTVQLKGR